MNNFKIFRVVFLIPIEQQKTRKTTKKLKKLKFLVRAGRKICSLNAAQRLDVNRSISKQRNTAQKGNFVKLFRSGVGLFYILKLVIL